MIDLWYTQSDGYPAGFLKVATSGIRGGVPWGSLGRLQ